ncbi:GNAT family N-acetyltransferase [Streptomyces sp. NBC_01275]|uniref:GNAT family N-acetyltransferase n=1 Tax=Streptomyces sp. NBC_01275 TaxID=2903807 RepID=UPI00224CD420|nr:GNAT family N-acetyltransferase [Streptomyces sp. NBC_01275]MCX4761667.1 GNAT family N-acetyltransferase [Streptomyces sp. NBC_01275]
MSLVRRALPEDAAEVLRLRQVMIDSVFPDGATGVTGATEAPGAPDWHAESLPVLRARLAEADGGGFGAFVVERPERPGALAALAVGTLEYRIGRAGNPRGTIGYVFSVATDPDARRRGYARACMDALLEWFRAQGARQIHLTASADAAPLYAALGFKPRPDPLMELLL